MVPKRAEIKGMLSLYGGEGGIMRDMQNTDLNGVIRSFVCELQGPAIEESQWWWSIGTNHPVRRDREKHVFVQTKRVLGLIGRFL